MNGWAKLPRVLADALVRDEIDLDGFAVVAFLTAAREYPSGEYVGTVEKLAADLRWEHTPDYLSKKLRELRNAEWLAFETKQGQRKPYVIRLGSRLITEPTSERGSNTTSDYTSDGNTPPQSEVTSDSPGSNDPANPQPSSVSTTFRPPTSPSSKEREEEREEERPGGSSSPRRQGAGRTSSLRITDECMACREWTAVEERREDCWLCDSCAAKGAAA